MQYYKYDNKIHFGPAATDLQKQEFETNLPFPFAFKEVQLAESMKQLGIICSPLEIRESDMFKTK